MITLYVSEHCSPCQQIKEIAKTLPGDQVRIVDIETEEGFNEFVKEVLDKGDGFVPTAFKDGQQCKISIKDEDTLEFDCPETKDPESPAS